MYIIGSSAIANERHQNNNTHINTIASLFVALPNIRVYFLAHFVERAARFFLLLFAFSGFFASNEKVFKIKREASSVEQRRRHRYFSSFFFILFITLDIELNFEIYVSAKKKSV